MKRGFFNIFLVLIFLGLDFITKHWAYRYFHGMTPSFYKEISLFQIGGVSLSISLVFNKGMAWGFLSSYPFLLLVFRIILILVLAFYTFFSYGKSLKKYALLLILIGALGNVIDCFVYGAVVDMIHLVLFGYSFPVFNLADSLIFLGVSFLFLEALYVKDKKRYVH